MFRFVQLWVPPLTPATAPVTRTISLTKGIITRWFVGFPDGCADLVHATVYEFEHRILPRAEDENLFWNNQTFEIPDSYALVDEPYEIELRVWSEDDSYDQYVVLGVALEDVPEDTPVGLLRRLLDALVGPGG